MKKQMAEEPQKRRPKKVKEEIKKRKVRN